MMIDYYRNRRTLDAPFTLEGTGLHTGESVRLTVKPAEAGNGITLRRLDREVPSFRASYKRVVDTQRHTTVGRDGATIRTVEHLLAAFFGLGVTDVTVEVDGPEIPVLDGSALPFVEAIDGVGLRELDDTRPVHHPEESYSTTMEENSLVLVPSPSLQIDYTVSYNNPAIGDQFSSLKLTPETFRESIAPARTYGFKEEIEELFEAGLARGGSLDNALIVDEEGNFLGDEPRIEKEFVRHKILDLLGDLALAEQFVAGRIVGVKGSHELNLRLMKELSLDRTGPFETAPGEPEEEDAPLSAPLDIQEIRAILPHRYPLLLVDRVLSIHYDEKTAVGYKNVTFNEEYFQGHFPDDPVMPGVLIIEAMAQLGAVYLLGSPEREIENVYFAGLDDVKWRKPIRPGDRVYFEVESRHMHSRFGQMEGKALVDDELAAEGLIKFAVVDS